MNSPYVISGYVTGADFYGRRDLLGEITAGRYCGTYILGTRQVGKTSLLRQVEMQVPAIFLDLQLASERLEELIGWARREVHHKRQNWPWLPPEEDLPTGDLFDLLTTLDKQVLEAGQRLWVLMDEAEIWVHFARTNPEVLHRLRGTVQNCSALRVVLVAAKRLSEANTLTGKTGSPFLSGFAVRYLGPLSQRDGAALLRQDQSPTPVAVENGLLSHLLSLAGGHPLLLQLLGERLYEDGQLRSPTEGDLVGVLDQVVNITGVLPNDFAALSDPERAILRMLSSGQPLPHGTNPTYLHGLTALGVLRREGDSYAIGNDFFARWLREQADWAVKPEISAEGTLAVYTQAGLDRLADHSTYQTGLCQLLERLGQGHPLYQEALVYQQRLDENIARSRRYGDTETRKAERSEIIDRLNALALSALGISFKELCGLATPAAG